MIKKIPRCVFCNLEEKLKIYATKNFFVIFDPYPLVEGHLIISSKAHYGCLGDLPYNMLEEIFILKEKVAKIITKVYRNVCFYEHGRAGGCLPTDPNNRMCHHLHLHAIPFYGDIVKDLELKFKPEKLDNFFKVKEYYEGLGEYLYFENSLGEMMFYSVNEGDVPMHYFRTLISKYIGKPHLADWSLFPHRDTCTLKTASKKIQQYHYLFD